MYGDRVHDNVGSMSVHHRGMKAALMSNRTRNSAQDLLTCQTHSLTAHEAPVLLRLGRVTFAVVTAGRCYRSKARSSRLAYNCRQNRTIQFHFPFRADSQVFIITQRSSVAHTRFSLCHNSAPTEPLVGGIDSDNVLWRRGIFKQVYL